VQVFANKVTEYREPQLEIQPKSYVAFIIGGISHGQLSLTS
jgi:hypothetical protein